MARKSLSGPFVLKKLVRLAGIEPTTPWFVAKYSIQLSYSREAPNYSSDCGKDLVVNRASQELNNSSVSVEFCGVSPESCDTFMKLFPIDNYCKC